MTTPTRAQHQQGHNLNPVSLLELVGDNTNKGTEDGNLVWNDYDMIFPIEDLYTNDILHITKEAVV